MPQRPRLAARGRIGWTCRRGSTPCPIRSGPSPKHGRRFPTARRWTVSTTAARSFWGVPDGAEIIAAPGASALIARLPGLLTGQRVSHPRPTYNEHAASLRGRRMDRCWRWRRRCQCQCAPEQPRWTAHGRGRNRPGRCHNHRRKLLRHVSRGIAAVHARRKGSSSSRASASSGGSRAASRRDDRRARDVPQDGGGARDRGRCPAPRLRSARARWKIAPGPRRRARGWPATRRGWTR
jgi:hypothetical protein